MSRCVRKVIDGDGDFYIVYCNTADVLFPFMFEDEQTARKFVQYIDNGYSSIYHQLKQHQGTITMEIVEEAYEWGKTYR